MNKISKVGLLFIMVTANWLPLVFSTSVFAGVNTPPTADAGDDLEVDALESVNLSGFGSDANDPNQTLTYLWEQVSGLDIVLIGETAPEPSFQAPSLPVGGESVVLTFSLIVNDGEEDSLPDTVDVTVVAPPKVVPLTNAGVLNSFIDPAGLGLVYGDILFSPDGTFVHLIVDSEESSSRVLVADVIRDVAGNITGFGGFIDLFDAEYIDTGLTYAPGSDTLFYYQYDTGVGQRTPSNAQEIFEVQNYDISYGGMSFIPEKYSNASQLLKADYNNNELWLHAIADDNDGTFTVSPATFVSGVNIVGGNLGDIEYITEGSLADNIIFANYKAGPMSQLQAAVYTVEVDEVTGLPINDPVIVPFAEGVDDAWGLSFDPITGNLWIIQFSSSILTQLIMDDLIYESGFE